MRKLIYVLDGNVKIRFMSLKENSDELDLLVTLLSDANKNECFNSGGDDDEINVLDRKDSYYDSEGDILYLESLLNDDLVHRDPSIPAMSVASILEGFTDEPPLEENDELFDLEPKNDDWKKIFECILPSCDDISPIEIPEEKAVTFSIPLFNSNDDFISSDDESLSDEDVPEDNVKIYSNPLFEFDYEYISSDVNPLFDEVLENIEIKDSYDSNLDELDLLVTLLSDANKNECFNSGGDDDEINVLDRKDSYYDSEGDILYLESLLNDDLVHRDPSIP
nr:hypothetical protein [Tanacetum cinerariifolium]